MRPILLFLLFFFSVSVGSAQNDSLRQQINDQVWKPFMQSFSHFSTDSFMQVHSREVMRVLQDSKTIQNYQQYYEATRRSDEGSRKNGRKRSIELRFTHRIASDVQAFEIGYYKTTSFRGDGTSRSFYGRFHVALRKESGQWKILLDTDTSEGITEAMFLAADPL